MLGAIAGDIIGSVFEKKGIKTTDFELFSANSTFTDDTVLTVAIADCLLHQKAFDETVRAYALRYPNAGYGGTFRRWMSGLISGPYNSWGNGSAMRVSPVGFAYNNLEGVLEVAKQTAEITHNHPEGIKGAQATAAAVHLARNGSSKTEIKDFIAHHFEYNLNRTLAEIRPNYQFDVSCQGSVPEAIIAFFESENVEDAIRKGISLGGDADTIACIAGGIAHAFYKEISPEIMEEVMRRLPEDLWVVTEAFMKRFGV